MTRPFYLCALVALAASCATPGPLNRAALRATHPRTIVAALGPTPAFRGKTSSAQGGVAMLGLLGLLVGEGFAQAEGRKLEASHLYDPADAITAAIMKRMATRFSLQTIDGGNAVDLDSSAGELSRKYARSDLVLDVRTADWGFAPTRLGHYAIFYEGTLRLVDTRNQTILAEGACNYHPVDDEDAPTYDQLTAGNAAIIKSQFRALVSFCIDDYRTRILGLFGT
jgi:hypothetical protein